MKRLSKNILSITASDVARRLIGFLTVAYLTRTITVDQFGIINVGFAILTYALLTSSFGLTTYGSRTIARGHSADVVGTIVMIRLIAGVIVLLIISAAAFAFLTDRAEISIIVVLSVSVIPFAFLLDWFFQGKERMGVIGAARFIGALTYFLLIVTQVRSSQDVLWVAVGSLVSDTLTSLTTWIFFRKDHLGHRIVFSMKGARAVLRSSLPMGIGSVIAAMTMNLPILVIGIFLSNYDVGIYSAAQKFVFFLLMFDRIIGTVFLPASSRISAEAPGALSSILSQAKKWIIIVALPVCVGGTILAQDIMVTVFGAQYLASVNVFRILIWFFFATVIHTIYSSGMIAAGGEKIYGKVMLLSAGIYILLIIAGVLISGVSGAAAGMVAAELATLVLMANRLKLYLRIAPSGSLFRIAASSLIMGSAILLLPHLPLVITVIAGALIYTLGLFVFRGVTYAEIKMIGSRFI